MFRVAAPHVTGMRLWSERTSINGLSTVRLRLGWSYIDRVGSVADVFGFEVHELEVGVFWGDVPALFLREAGPDVDGVADVVDGVFAGVAVGDAAGG